MRAAFKKVIRLDFSGKFTVQPPAASADTVPVDENQRVALVATTDRVSQHWAPRWLGQAGFAAVIVHSADEALAFARKHAPDLLLADASLTGSDHSLLIESFPKTTGLEVPTIALCAGTSDLAVAAETNVTDIVRRPYDWQIISQRAVRATKAHDTYLELQRANDQLNQIKLTANAAERDRAVAIGTDTLTGLPNGERFRSLSHKAISARGNLDKLTSIVVIGLDRYRIVNEAIGHANADRVLHQFADRLRNCVGDRDVIGSGDDGAVTAIASRLGGARFAVQFANGAEAQIARFRDAIGRELEQPFQVDGQSVYLTASLGAAIYPTQCDDAERLLHSAETAMLQAREGNAGLRFYDPLEQTSCTQAVKLDSMLRDALPNNELALHFQPIIDTATSKVVAAEALLRWDHPIEGRIPPDVFVPVAERSGLMVDIGKFVIDAACRQLRDWLDQGMKPIRVAVNVSLCQLVRGDFAEAVEASLAKHAIDASLLEIELSERGVLNQRPEVINEIRRLEEVGVRISIDDFGTGQAAIGYLKDLPIDVIKIDRSYISSAACSARDEAIASGMVALAQRLNATVICEGVETTEQLEMIRHWGSQECQGFLFSPAVPAAEFFERFA